MVDVSTLWLLCSRARFRNDCCEFRIFFHHDVDRATGEGSPQGEDTAIISLILFAQAICTWNLLILKN